MNIKTIAVLAAGLAAMSANAVVLVNEGFESPTWTLGQDIAGLNGFDAASDTGYTIDNTHAKSGTQSAMFDTAPAAGSNWAWKNTLVTSGIVSAKASVYIESISGATIFSYFGLDLYSSSVSRLALLQVKADGTVWFGNATLTQVGTAGLNQWNDLEVRANLTTKVATAYVNGSAVGSGVSFTATNFNDADMVSRATGFERGWYDDYKIETVPEPMTISAMALGLAAIARKRRK
ncbi:MAG: PEP-CTERM sorting domain-containing protein [Armatimonadetes bacterium]|nr:PEP-CTERM sorting domain-containing protein [Armatimonadota bacterium]